VSRLRVEEISPELALVDAELAAEARTSLPDPPQLDPPKRPKRRRRRRTAFALVGVLVLGAAAGVVLFEQTREAEPRERTGVLAAAKTLAEPPRSLPTPPGQAPRLYTWAPSEGAAYYQVTFVRDGRTFHSAETPNPWLKLPETLRFPPGTYRWSVQPALPGDDGVSLEDAVLVRTFRVTRG
jgi:hypothetical protein